MRPTEHPFLALLRAPAARRMAVSGFVARLREAGTGLAIVLTARQATGSYAAAGLAVAAYLLGAAVSRPLHGRLVDRRGPRALLLPSFVNALALAALAVASEQRARDGVVLALAVAIGLTLPAISATLRSSWPRLIGVALDSAYAFDTVLYELSLVASPALVGLLATAAAPWAGLALVAVAGMLGTTALVFAVPGPSALGPETPGARPSATSTPLEPEPSRKAPPLEADRDGSVGGGDDVAETPARPGRLTGGRALLSGAVPGLVLVACFVGLAEGSLTVIVPAFATAHGGGVRGGLLLSALSIGSLVGATATGAVAAKPAWSRRLAGTSAALTLAFVVLAAVPVGPVAFGALLALVGAALAPALTAGFVALQREAPAVSLTEAFTWASFAAAGGAAGGQALAGQLIAGLGVRTALWEPALAAAVASALAVALVRPAWRRRSKVRTRVG